MAIATLALCFNNPNVFTGVVKIRKGLAVRMMMDSTSMDSVLLVFDEHLQSIKARIPTGDPSVREINEIVDADLKVGLG